VHPSGPRILAVSGSIVYAVSRAECGAGTLIGNLEFANIVMRQRIRRVLLDTFVHFVNEERFAAELSELTLSQGSELVDSRSSVTPHDVKGFTTPTI